MALNDVMWTFSKKIYESMEEFNKDIKEYYDRMREYVDREWNPDEVAVNQPEIYVDYEAWIKGKEDLMENETADEEELSEEYADDGYFQVDVRALLKADNGKYFTNLELITKVHNQQANKELGDHVFFEGMDSDNDIDGIPVFYVACGS